MASVGKSAVSDLMVRVADPCAAVGAAAPVTDATREEWTRRIELIVQSIQARLAGAVEPELIRTEVVAEFGAYSGAPVRDFIPILVEARVRARLLRAPRRSAESAS